MSDVAIRVENLSKLYHIGAAQKRHDTLRDVIGDWRLEIREWAAHLINPQSSILNPQSDDTIWALKDVSFEIKRGEVVGIIGRNGAGKSTLLKILSCITEPTKGRAIIYGRVGSLLEVGTGFHPELTGRENIYLNGAILGMKRTEIDRKFDEIVAFAEIEKFLDTPVKRYSSGMYVRLAFAVAAHLEPEILVVDEVLAVGDLSFQTKCINKMQDVSSAGRTVLFVSHNMGAIHSLCPSCILLSQGEISSSGSTDAVIQTYLSQNRKECPEYVQPHNSEKPIHLRRVYLTNLDGDLATEFRYDQGFRIMAEYEVNHRISDCSIWLGIRTADQEIAFDTADSDADISRLDLRELGYYRAMVELPGKWLNAGKYYLVIGISRLAAKTNYDRVEVSGFTVLDVGVPEQGRPGILQPFINWLTTKIE